MKTLTDEQRKSLNERIAETEKRTGTQVVLAVIERSDAYPELPWKAFALGASVAGLLGYWMSVRDALDSSTQAVFLAMVMVLVAGGGLALLAVFVPSFAKLFLTDDRAEVETRQYAESLFLSRELFATPKRKGLLMFISLFERRVVVLPDTGLRSSLSEEALQEIIGAMQPHLATRQTAGALDAGLKKLEELVRCEEAPDNSLPNGIIEEKGA